MTLGQTERNWIKDKFRYCYRYQKECEEKTDIISVDMMQWCRCQSNESTPTWELLGQAFLNQINYFVVNYPSATTLYFVFDYCGKNDAKLFCKQIRAKREIKYKNNEFNASMNDLLYPELQSQFSQRLFATDIKWRCNVFYQFLAQYYYDHRSQIQQHLITKSNRKIVISGINFNTNYDQPLQLNDGILSHIDTTVTFRRDTQLCERYQEADLRQIFYLLKHENKLCMVFNQDGDLFSIILMYIANYFYELRQHIVWVYTDTTLPENKKQFLDLLLVSYNIKDEIEQRCPWYSLDVACLIIITTIYLKGNDFIHTPLAYTNINEIYETILLYGQNFPKAFPYLTSTTDPVDLHIKFNDFQLFATYCYLTCKSSIVLKPLDWKTKDTSNRIPYNYLQLFDMPYQIKKNLIVQETENWKLYNENAKLPSSYISNAYKRFNKNVGMIDPSLLPILMKQILFCIQYSLVFRRGDVNFEKPLKPFAVNESTNKSLWGVQLVNDVVTIANSVDVDEDAELVDRYMSIVRSKK